MMKKRRMIYLLFAGLLAAGGITGWKLTRAAYESAEYTVLVSDGEFEIRRYPDLQLVSTNMLIGWLAADEVAKVLI